MLPRVRLLLVILLLGGIATDTAAEDVRERKLFEDAERVIEKVRKADVHLTLVGADDKPVAGHRVRVRLVRHAFLFGAAISLRDDVAAPADSAIAAKDALAATAGQEKAYRDAFASLFNYATTENIMKWKPLERRQGEYNWGPPDMTLDWCEKNGIQLKSHCLIWGTKTQGVPDWLLDRTPPDVLALMKNHVETVMKRYHGRIRYYDIINEPIHCDVFDRIAGPDHLEMVCRWAHEADPDAHLIINEYNLIARPADRRRLAALLGRLIDRGAPFDGIGIQAHSPGTAWHSPSAVVETLDDLAQLGKDLHITELTLETEGTDITGGYRTGKWTDEAQAEYYRQLYTLCFGHAKVRAITMWAVFDSRSWLKGGGIFDRSGRPKAAAKTLDGLINHTWHTEVELTTDGEGGCGFRGFKGLYDCEVLSPEGKVLKRVRMELGPEPARDVQIRLDAQVD